jgi:hypothetical protein
MSMNPGIATALAEQHRRDLVARADAHRLARAARGRRPAPAGHAAGHPTMIRHLLAAAKRSVRRLPLVKVPAAPRPS